MFVENIVLQYYTIDELQIPDHNDVVTTLQDETG